MSKQGRAGQDRTRQDRTGQGSVAARATVDGRGRAVCRGGVYQRDAGMDGWRDG